MCVILSFYLRYFCDSIIVEHIKLGRTMIKKIFIQNYKIFTSFELEFNNELNLIVGDNEAGKSTILEAINLALSKRLDGNFIEYELTPFLFNRSCVIEYLKSLKSGKPSRLPEIIIELYFDESSDMESFRGSMNSKKEDAIGVKLEIVFDEDYKEDYENLLKKQSKRLTSIPAEFYKVQWFSFANKQITRRKVPVRLSYIDATTIRLKSGTDYYLQDIIQTGLDSKERVGLSVAYRSLKETFSQEDSIRSINDSLKSKKGIISNKDLSISIDVSQKSNWEGSLVPHLDELPFHLIGKGEQSALKIMLALERKADESNVILIEEPENHLSFSSMNTLVSRIRDRCENKQIIITTHSAYVLNKLGLEHLILIYGNEISKLKNLSPETQSYFKRLSGYDTLRLVLAKKAILVEGPSDELIVQKAYFSKHKKLPIEDGVDVINVRGLSFSRFLDIAKELKKEVVVVTDNDGDYHKNVEEKYADYSDEANISICASDNDTLTTLEPQIANCNALKFLNSVLGRSEPDKDSLCDYMQKNKTLCALKIFESSSEIEFPQYIKNAIE